MKSNAALETMAPPTGGTPEPMAHVITQGRILLGELRKFIREETPDGGPAEEVRHDEPASLFSGA